MRSNSGSLTTGLRGLHGRILRLPRDTRCRNTLRGCALRLRRLGLSGHTRGRGTLRGGALDLPGGRGQRGATLRLRGRALSRGDLGLSGSALDLPGGRGLRGLGLSGRTRGRGTLC